MHTVRSLAALALATAMAGVIPALSETKQITAPAAKSVPAVQVPVQQVRAPARAPNAATSAPALQAPMARPAQKSFPVTLPEAKAAADAAKKPPQTWSASEIADAKSRCTAILKRIQAVAIPEAPIKDGICGTPAPVQLISIGRNPEVALSPPAIVTCEMAEAIYSWMKTDVQPLAKQKLGTEVIKIETMSSYSCRNAYGRKRGRLSEHGVANALDIRGFVTAAGKTAYVLDHWGTPQREILARIAAEKAKAEELAAKNIAAAKAADAARFAAKPNGKNAPHLPTQALEPDAAEIATETIAEGTGVEGAGDGEDIGGAQNQGAEIVTRRTKPVAGAFAISPDHLGGPKTVQKQTALVKPSDEARRQSFLHDVHASACRQFGTTLGPEANAAHRNHFHVDLAQRKSVKICD